MKIALAHDHLNQIGGAERVVFAMHQVWKDAPLHTILYDRNKIGDFFNSLEIKTSLVQKLPFSASKLRWYLFIIPFAMGKFDFSGYDAVISSASAFGKYVKVPRGCVHFCYCHTPTRYLWSEPSTYIDEVGGNFLIKKTWPFVLEYLRKQDLVASEKVDYFIANSKFVAERIKLYYKRDSNVIYPPVCTTGYPKEKKQNYFVMVSRLRPYKKIDIAINAFNRIRAKLVIIGSGEDLGRLKSIAGKNIFFAGNVSEKKKKKILSGAAGFIHPQIEDFGISAVEAMAAGTPVAAYNLGGANETVLDKKTGLFFEEQTWQCLADCVIKMRKMDFDYSFIKSHAENFSREKFMSNIKSFVENRIDKKE